MKNGQQIELTLAAAGERLDRALAEAIPELSRARWQQLIKDKQVLVAGTPLKASYRLEGGERVVVTLPETAETELIPQDIPLDIRYEDSDFLVVNKAAGMVVHPAAGHSQGTLVNAILAHCPDLPGIGGEKRPGIVHRLDKETSGLMVVAKTETALRHLQAQFKARTVEKVYLALVEGQVQPPAALIDAPIGRNPRQRKQMAVIVAGSARARSARARPAQTEYQTLVAYDDYTLLSCHPRTGRTHQIRVHLAYIGHPLVGDKVYGRRKQRLPLKRHFLHAARLILERPSDNQRLTFNAELPADLQSIVDTLGIDANALNGLE